MERKLLKRFSAALSAVALALALGTVGASERGMIGVKDAIIRVCVCAAVCAAGYFVRKGASADERTR